MRALAIKAVLLLPVLFIVSLGTFLMVDLVPGDPAFEVLGPNATPTDLQRVREELGVDKPIVERYGDWLSRTVKGDLGRNIVPPVQDVSTILSRAFPVNLQLAVMALFLALIIAIPLGMVSAYRSGSRLDRVVSACTFGMISVPSFLAAILLVLMFAVNWQIFPIGQWARPTDRGWFENLRYAFLPALTLGLHEASVFTRLLRSDMIGTLQENFILAARAKGVPPWRMLRKHALRPSSFSLITLAGISFGRLVGGTVIVEQIFSLPGVGTSVIAAAQKHDYPIIQGGVLVIALLYVLSNLLVDTLYAYLDPRIRRGRA